MASDNTYSVADYGAMISDTARMRTYVRALRQSVKPGCVVIDIGTGTGIFALVACQLGARKVYAIETEDVIEVARENAAASGCGDRIEFIQAISTEVTLPERGDVLIADLSGALPWFRQHIPSIVDARRRLLAADGVMIPRCDVAWAAVVNVEDVYGRWPRLWDPGGFRLDMEAARRIVTNSLLGVHLTPENLLSDTLRWGHLDYAVVEDPDIRARLTWTVTRMGAGHGFAAGFERTVADGVCMSNAPTAADAIRPTVYPVLYFPWLAPVGLDAGDIVTVDLDASLAGRDYIWTWKTLVTDSRQATEKANFSQSTFFGAPLSPATLRKSAAEHVPSLSEDGRIACLVLQSMTGGRSLGEIAQLVSTEFPARFSDPQDALSRVVDLTRQYT